MKKIRLVRIKENAWGHMTYQDEETGKYYLDLDYGICEEISLHACSPSDDMDGEPDYRVESEFEIVNPITDREKREKQYQFQYMMLDRLSSDCRAFFGDGREDESLDCRYKNEKMIWGKNIKALIEEIKKIWAQIPEDLKPEWLTREEIERYEKQLQEKA